MIDFMSKRRLFFIISLILIVIGIAAAIINGFQWDIQFEGGTILRIEMPDETFDSDVIETRLRQEFNKNITTQKVTTYDPGSENDSIAMLTLKVTKNETLTDEELNRTYEILRTEYNVDENAESQVQSIEPFIGREMRARALRAAMIAMVLIVLYVWVRFSKINGLAAALFSIVALLHDVLIMVSVYTVLRIPINESFVAAVLTILGYSMNDTIIIYDRIRENSGMKRQGDMIGLVNRSLTQSLPRSINTLLTTLICVLTVYIFASIHNIAALTDFTLPLMVGLISGTYSSFFIASPLWMMCQRKSTMAAAKR